MKSWPDFLKELPITVTPEEADEKREELAATLRILADNIEDGTFNFHDFTLSISINRPVDNAY